MILSIQILSFYPYGPSSVELGGYETGSIFLLDDTYRKIYSISRTKSQSLDVSCILLQLSSLNPLKPGVKLRMKM